MEDSAMLIRLTNEDGTHVQINPFYVKRAKRIAGVTVLSMTDGDEERVQESGETVSDIIAAAEHPPTTA
jgi:hypothetical protein